MKSRTFLKINLDNLEYNFYNVRKHIPSDVKILSVIKADAYGHGAVSVGRFLDDKVDFFGVSCIEEAMELKVADIKSPILILGRVFPFYYNLVVENDIRIPIFSLEDAIALSEEADKQNKTVKFHFCVDTGMSRIGFEISKENADICKQISELKNIECEGIFSHFATADDSDLTKTYIQKDKFNMFCDMLEERGINLPIKHIDNSAGIIDFNDHYNMVRMGIITYGLYPSQEVNKSVVDLKPVLSWHTIISHIKTLDAGKEISYGGTFVTDKPTVVATIPIGYADGYSRSLSNIGYVLVNGIKAPILGRICMDQFMIDVTDIDCSIGDKVVIIGNQKEASLSIEEVSEMANSFNYEFCCNISKRVTRIYTYRDKELFSLNTVYNL